MIGRTISKCPPHSITGASSERSPTRTKRILAMQSIFLYLNDPIASVYQNKIVRSSVYCREIDRSLVLVLENQFSRVTLVERRKKKIKENKQQDACKKKRESPRWTTLFLDRTSFPKTPFQNDEVGIPFPWENFEIITAVVWTSEWS